MGSAKLVISAAVLFAGCAGTAPATRTGPPAPGPASHDEAPRPAVPPTADAAMGSVPDSPRPEPLASLAPWAELLPGERRPMFDGTTLAGWRVIGEEDFPGRGPVRVEDGEIVIGVGSPFTGIAWERGFPIEGFEIELSARRTYGNDIFCGLTVPVGQEHVTLVLGGWGNCLVGLSCVNGFNASENQTTRAMAFENDRWYRVALRVDAERIRASVDGAQIVDLERGDNVFSVYRQLLPCRPVGFFTWRTEGRLRDIAVTRLAADASP